MKGFIFDLDGTLLNSIADLGNSLNTILLKYNLPTHELSTYHQFVGNGMQKLVERAIPSNYPDEDKILTEFMAEYAKRYCEASQLYDGVLEILMKLNESGYPIAICTNKKQEYTDQIVTHYLKEIDFVAILGDRFDGKHKPNPYYPLEIAKIMALSPENIYFVGDSNVDMNTAKNAGMKGIGVSWGFRSVAELESSGANKVIHAMDELLQLL